MIPVKPHIPRVYFSHLGGRLIPSAMLTLFVSPCKNLEQFLPNSNWLALVTDFLFSLGWAIFSRFSCPKKFEVYIHREFWNHWAPK